MKIHEYQAKELFRDVGVPVPDGSVAGSVAELEEIAAKTTSFPVAVKAQIHAGGRGKGGGVQLARSRDEICSIGAQILGMNLVTDQTGPEGNKVQTVLVEQGVSIAHEYYLSLIADRNTASVLLMASAAGGMDIEQVAAETPEKIVRLPINPNLGLHAYHLRCAAYGLGLSVECIKPFGAAVRALYALFLEKDCSQIEINPLVLTDDNRFIALDAKINFDDCALYRHPELLELHDPNEDDPLEAEASKYNLNYIKLDGSVGNMVNGAGLAMATMDIIKSAGAEPANFLDVGGGASAEMVEHGFRIILKDTSVRAILVNIFGGILRCDVLAQGIVQAAQNCEIQVPVVVRMEGTNVDQGKKILTDSGLNLLTAKDLRDAAEKISALAGDHK